MTTHLFELVLPSKIFRNVPLSLLAKSLFNNKATVKEKKSVQSLLYVLIENTGMKRFDEVGFYSSMLGSKSQNLQKMG